MASGTQSRDRQLRWRVTMRSWRARSFCGTAHTAANMPDRRGDLRARELSHFLPAKCECAAGDGCRKGRSEVQPLLPLSLIRPQFLLAVVPIYPRPFLVDGSFTPATDYRMSAVVNFE